MIFFVKLVSSALPYVFLLVKLVSSILPNVLMLANHWFWDTRANDIFEIVDNIVSGDFILLWFIY